MKNKEKIIVVDGNYVLMRSKFAFKNFHREDGEPNGMLFGFSKTISHLITKHKPDYLIFTFDVSKSKKRIAIDPNYKANRKHNDSPETIAMFNQMKLARKMVELLGFKAFIVPECEADDCAAKIVKDYKDNYEINLYTVDKDWYQLLLNDNVKMLNSKKGTEILYNRYNFIEDWGINPYRWPEVAAMTGDASDNVIGVKGIGNKTALKYIKKYEDLWTALDNEEKLKPHKEQCLKIMN